MLRRLAYLRWAADQFPRPEFGDEPDRVEMALFTGSWTLWLLAHSFKVATTAATFARADGRTVLPASWMSMQPRRDLVPLPTLQVGLAVSEPSPIRCSKSVAARDLLGQDTDVVVR